MGPPKARWILALLVTLPLLGWFVWPTIWVYGTEERPVKRGTITIPIRVHRITGQKQIGLSEEGWVDGPVEFD